MDLHLTGKRALVAGASRGLGYAAALGLAREGARVAINSRRPESILAAAQAIEKETGAQVIPLDADLTDPAAAEQVVRRAGEALGGLDILITNTGGPPAGNFEGFDDAAWLAAVELNFLSHVRLIRAALPALRRSDSPSVLTLTSYSVRQPIPNLVLSTSVRAATAGLTKTLAIELGGEGIRFNSILPGWTETERVGQIMEARARMGGTTPEDELRKQAGEIPLGRLGDPQEFANAAVFLVSPAAAYITGVLLPVDGGAIKAW